MRTAIDFTLTTAALLLLLSTPTAAAGEPEAPATPAAPLDSLTAAIDGVLSTGYDSSYMHRGINRGQEAIWTGLDFSVPFPMPLGSFTASAGAWYINPTEGPQNSNLRGALNDELRLYGGIATTVGAVDMALGYTHYFLGPEGVLGDQDEVGINFGTSVGRFDLGLAYYYNFDFGDPNSTLGRGRLGILDHYIEPSIGTTFEINERVNIVLSAAAGFYTTDFHHWEVRLAAPIRISETAIFEPYIAYLDNRASGQLNCEAQTPPTTPASPISNDDDFWAGFRLSVIF